MTRWLLAIGAIAWKLSALAQAVPAPDRAATHPGRTAAAKVSRRIVFLSSSGCAAQNSDLMSGGGTDDTACINSILAKATESSPVWLVQDGVSLISGRGIEGPRLGNWRVTGLGAGIRRVPITACGIADGVATFVTAESTLRPGEAVQLSDLTHCAAINNALVRVLQAGLSSRGFRVSVPKAPDSPTGAESANAVQLYGTGFYQAANSEDGISNGFSLGGTTCGPPGGFYSPPRARGANVHLADFALNGNSANNGNYCYGIQLSDLEDISVERVTVYNTRRFSLTLDSDSRVTVRDNRFYTSGTTTGGLNGDGVHLDGNTSNVLIEGNYFRTNDDPIALNAVEGYCGPISNVQISNNVLDKTFSVLRIYNNSVDRCANGLVPRIQHISVHELHGSSEGGGFVIGIAAAKHGTLEAAITDVSISDIAIDMLGGAAYEVPFVQIWDNIGEWSMSDITLRGFQAQDYIGLHGNTDHAQSVDAIYLSNNRVIDTATGSTFKTLLDVTCGGKAGTVCPTIGTLKLDGFGVDFEGIPARSIDCLFCPNAPWGTATVSNVLATNIDMSHIRTLFGDSGFASLTPHPYARATIVGENGVLPGMQLTGDPGKSQIPGAVSLGGKVYPPSNCSFKGAIAPWVCLGVNVDGKMVYIPIEGP